MSDAGEKLHKTPEKMLKAVMLQPRDVFHRNILNGFEYKFSMGVINVEKCISPVFILYILMY